MIHKILVLADPSPVSEQALIEAVKIGQIYHSIITCIHPIIRHDDLLLKVGQDLKKRFEEIVSSTGLEFEWVMAEDPPGPAVVKAVITRNVDLAVLGSLGERGIKRQLVSSPVEYVVKNAPCNVLVVKNEHSVF